MGLSDSALKYTWSWCWKFGLSAWVRCEYEVAGWHTGPGEVNVLFWQGKPTHLLQRAGPHNRSWTLHCHAPSSWEATQCHICHPSTWEWGRRGEGQCEWPNSGDGENPVLERCSGEHVPGGKDSSQPSSCNGGEKTGWYISSAKSKIVTGRSHSENSQL